MNIEADEVLSMSTKIILKKRKQRGVMVTNQEDKNRVYSNTPERAAAAVIKPGRWLQGLPAASIMLSKEEQVRLAIEYLRERAEVRLAIEASLRDHQHQHNHQQLVTDEKKSMEAVKETDELFVQHTVTNKKKKGILNRCNQKVIIEHNSYQSKADTKKVCVVKKEIEISN